MKKTVYVIALMIVVLLNLLSVKVNAEDLNFTATLKSSSTKVELGKDFIVKINVDKFDALEDGISIVKANLEYDSNTFEAITSDSFSGVNDWKVTKYDESTGKLEMVKNKNATAKQDTCEITFKVKGDTKNKKGTIELTNIVAGNNTSEKELSSEDVSLEIEVGEKSDDDSNTNTGSSIRTITSNTNTDATSVRTIGNTNTNSNTNTNTNTNSNTNTNTNTNSDNTTSNYSNKNTNTNTDKMPNTGIDDSIMKAMVLVGLVGIFGYIKFKSIEK